MRYRCLILDHDDTAVDTTRSVHHPAHIRAMAEIRPGVEPADLETWFAKNFHPGIMPYLRDELGFSEADLEVEHRIWREHTTSSQPSFYPGFIDALVEYRDRGGLIAVASHSEQEVIHSHYRNANGGHRIEPDLVFGWDLSEEQRKPNPWPVLETMRLLDLEARDVLVVDDLKPGVDMAHAAGVDAAAAAWSHSIPEIETFMRKNCVETFATVSEFTAFILT